MLSPAKLVHGGQHTRGIAIGRACEHPLNQTILGAAMELHRAILCRSLRGAVTASEFRLLGCRLLRDLLVKEVRECLGIWARNTLWGSRASARASDATLALWKPSSFPYTHRAQSGLGTRIRCEPAPELAELGATH